MDIRPHLRRRRTQQSDPGPETLLDTISLPPPPSCDFTFTSANPPLAIRESSQKLHHNPGKGLTQNITTPSTIPVQTQPPNPELYQQNDPLTPKTNITVTAASKTPLASRDSHVKTSPISFRKSLFELAISNSSPTPTRPLQPLPRSSFLPGAVFNTSFPLQTTEILGLCSGNNVLPKPIDANTLVPEIKGIYARFVAIESQCIKTHNQDHSTRPTWRTLITLHRALLEKYHDFILASHHSSATPAIRRLATEYKLHGRMWAHGADWLLKMLRAQLPRSIEFMSSFTYMVYSTLSLLQETVPAFRGMWMELLGDLSRYQMVIAGNNLEARERWTAVGRDWYSKASDMKPKNGRLYHHLAVLAPRNTCQQLYYYLKSQCVPEPFEEAKKSIMYLVNSILAPTTKDSNSRLSAVDSCHLKAISLIIAGRGQVVDDVLQNSFYFGLFIDNAGRRWLEASYYVAISQCCVMIGGDTRYQSWLKRSDKIQCQPTKSSALLVLMNSTAIKLFSETVRVVSIQSSNPNVLPYLHCAFAFLYWLSHYEVYELVDEIFPWDSIIQLLNSFEDFADGEFRSDEVPGPPVPEDYALRGLPWAVYPQLKLPSQYKESYTECYWRRRRIVL
ncbi:hypothetical protein QBC36DRAFT_383089 [Triangularia setosa]|uniref:DNA/RNA-binding domain-containing protein n=1 Tax=Triangularia setosa TaxID=2587417 RepID=A0AAN6VY28_9PEZI|nr:hypothetical protein QBC36DRAFT_383089 [Podospora setosa]